MAKKDTRADQDAAAVAALFRLEEERCELLAAVRDGYAHVCILATGGTPIDSNAEMVERLGEVLTKFDAATAPGPCPAGPAGHGGRHNFTWKRRKAGDGFYCDYCGHRDVSAAPETEPTAVPPAMVRFTVRLLAFRSDEPGAVRLVLVPFREWNLAVTGPDDLSLPELVFYYGQNDVQPVAGKRSVSVGDVIETATDQWRVKDFGFERLPLGGTE